MDPLATVTLGGGCFWCLQPVFQELRGVTEVVVGYSGGDARDPSYEDVCTGRTGHAEVAEVTFDPVTVSLEDLLRVFFSVHDPTTLNRQGADVGTQYRSAIFFRTPEQQAAAHHVIREITPVWGRPVVTAVSPFTAFHPAEEYHQDYFAKNPDAGYCRAVVAPKMTKFRKQFGSMRKA